jgi:hypothetical protein
MKKINLILLILFAGTLARAQTLAPQVISSGGNYATGGGYSLSQDFGELAVQTLSAGSNILTQGFEQPFDMIAGVSNIQDPGLSITLYPNPATDQININVLSDRSTDYRFSIIDATGRQVETTIYAPSSIGAVHTMDVSNLASGMYFITVQSTDAAFSKTIQFNKN